MIPLVKNTPKNIFLQVVSLFQSQFLGTILACLDGYSHFLGNKFPFLFVALIDAFQKPRVLKMRLLIKRSTSSGVHLKSFAFMLAYRFFNVCNETLGKWPATALKVKSNDQMGFTSILRNPQGQRELCLLYRHLPDVFCLNLLHTATCPYFPI